jgi:hypothetical protein
MKNRLFASFLFLIPALLNAQTNTGIMETENPNSLVELENVAFRIDGVSGSAFNIKLFPTDSVDYTVILHFYSRKNDSTAFSIIPQSSMNADWHDFKKGVLAVVPDNTPDSEVNSQVQTLMRNMIAGTKEQKFDAYNAIMTGYGSPLKAMFE